MTRATIAGGTFVTAPVLLALVVRSPSLEQDAKPAASTPPAITPATPGSTEPAPEVYVGFLYGRITEVDGATYEGRLRWGRDQEAFFV